MLFDMVGSFQAGQLRRAIAVVADKANMRPAASGENGEGVVLLSPNCSE
jgi:hypothetical protein